ncbi:MAG: hypothetical protein Q4D85_00025 [Corynebacterium sp.]|uniref:hypothetical protein n=1 Tax=Corynebacterium sp. TaxID=1720 RepID=UPI0026DD2E51|nr:hypothetical protein [Corynebacterium sp.]MDO5097112.1 hypothetical protein [Corynebacterium sp.]
MEYEILLFIPDRDENNQVVIGPRAFSKNEELKQRYKNREATPSPELNSIVDQIDDAIFEFSTYSGDELYESVTVWGDRIIWILIAEPTAKSLYMYLMKLALDNGLGMVDRTRDFVALYGDDDQRFRLSVSGKVDMLAVSEAAIPQTCSYSADADGFFIVVDDATSKEQRFIQAFRFNTESTFRFNDKTVVPGWWKVEYHEGDNEHHYLTFVPGPAEAAKAIQQWMRGAPEFFELGWEKML